MANIGKIDWAKIAAETEVRSRVKTDMVNTIRSAAKVFMQDGREYPVNTVAALVSAGLTQDARTTNPEAPVVKVNWSTARSALDGMTGVKEIRKNVFQMTKKVAPK